MQVREDVGTIPRLEALFKEEEAAREAAEDDYSKDGHIPVPWD